VIAPESARALPAVSPRFAIGLIAFVAFFVRLLHVLSYDPWPTSDMSIYVDMAVRRLTFQTLFTREGLCWFAPGYSLLLKPFFLALEPEAALRGVRIAQALLGAWSCVLIYRLARRIHSRRAGLVAALMTCFYPHFLFYSSVYMSENLFTPLYYAALLSFLRMADRPSPSASYRAGIIAALAALTRPVAVTLFPAALFAAWRASFSRAGRLKALATVAAGGLTLLGPWAIRNQIAYGHFTLLAPTEVLNLAIGNLPGATGEHRYLDEPGGVFEQAGRLRPRILMFLMDDPLGALATALGNKWARFWDTLSPWPIHSLNPMLFDGDFFFPFVSWRCVSWLGWIGLGLLLARRGPAAWLTPACLLAYAAFHLVYFAETRFRLPAEGFFLAWGGVAVASIASLIPRPSAARAPAWAAAIVVGLACVLAQAGWSAAATRSSLADPASLLAEGEQVPVVASGSPVDLFGTPSVPLDRHRGHFLKLSFSAYRQGPDRDTPENGALSIDFLDANGRSLGWDFGARYYLYALPPDRWTTVPLKTHIPTAAASCRISISPAKESPDIVILDHPVLRYSGGNNLYLEFIFPYLRYPE